MAERRKRIVFTWSGFPDYAARCVRAVIDQELFEVEVIGTRPKVPIEGMERSLGKKITLIEPEEEYSWESLNVPIPDVLFSGGYAIPSFQRLVVEARDAGAKTVLMSDNNWVGTLRQLLLEPIRHRVFHRPRFDAALVPGAAGVRLVRSWGYSERLIRAGLYGADSAVFFGGPTLEQRPKKFLFVGQFIERKNILRLTDAFIQFAEQFSDWTLELCGSGPLANLVPLHPRIEISGFVQPFELAGRLRCAKCLVLPSIEEHWGVVVHEAALSGCALALSKTVGSAADLASDTNATLFDPFSKADIVRALIEMAQWDDARWRNAELESRCVAKQFGPSQFAVSVSELVRELTDQTPIWDPH